MALFLVAATPASAGKIGEAIEEHYPEAKFQIALGQWLVSDMGKTAEQVAKSLGVGAGENSPTVLVVGVGSYWGHHNRDLWPWMKEQLERQNG